MNGGRLAPSRKQMGDEELPELVLPIEDRDHCHGTPGAKYSVVEYGEYGSSPCARLQPIVMELVRELGDDLCFAFRHFPQPKLHPRSRAAAEAAEGAEEQGKFWLMHERLFQRSETLTESDLRELAKGLPLEMDTFDRDLRSGVPGRRVDADIESGVESGVADTPTLFLNGRMHAGSYEFLPLLKALGAGSD